MLFDGYDKEMRKTFKETFKEKGVEKPKYPKSLKEKIKKDYKEIAVIVREGNNAGYIGDKDTEATLPDREQLGRAYGLPKDHKEIMPDTGIPPLRLVISCSGTIMECPGKIVDDYLWPVDMAAASFIQDMQDLLRRVERT